MQKFYKRLATLVFMGLLITIGQGVSAVTPHSSQEPIVKVTTDAVQVTWNAPAPAIIQHQDGSVSLDMPGYQQLDLPGAPRLPVASVLVALPPGAEPLLEVNALEERTLPLSGPLELSPMPEGVLRDENGIVVGSAFTPVEEAIAFAPAPVELEYLGVMRGVPLARLIFYPLRPDGGGIVFTDRLQVTVHFRAPTVPPKNGETISDQILEMLKTRVINPEQVLTSHHGSTPSDAITIYQAADVAIVEVIQQGITEITYEDLENAGFPVATIIPKNIHLTHAGSEVSVEWEGDDDTSFEPGERFLFYAEPRSSRWTSTDTYFLKEEISPGSRMNSHDADPDGLPIGQASVEIMGEENLLYVSECSCDANPNNLDADRWVWAALQRGMTETYTIYLQTVDSSQPATLTLWMEGYTNLPQNPDHRVTVLLNNETLTPTIEWDGTQSVEASLEVPSSTLQNGANKLTLNLPGIDGVPVEGMWLDALSIQHTLGNNPAGGSIQFGGESTQHAYHLTLTTTSGLRAYDVTDAENPLILTAYQTLGNTVTLGDPAGGGKHRYALSTEGKISSPYVIRIKNQLASQDQGFTGADHVIVSHSDFTPGLADLVALRESQGLTVIVEDVMAIYDNFAEGRPIPEAIHAYLEDAYHNWVKTPTYVLLVGDGNVDPKQYQVGSSETFIPPYLADVDPWIGETASDNRFVTVDGDDILPDMLIGRLPVNSLEEIRIVVEKIVAYETSSPGNWSSNVTFVADNEDLAGDFPSEAEYLASNFIPERLNVQRIYHPGGSGDETRQAVQNSWNAGTGLITYIGHATIHQWAGDFGEEPFLHFNDVGDLTNGLKLPIVLDMTCFTGSFHYSWIETLDESLLRHPDGGAVAVWGPTGLGLSTGHIYLAEGFLQNIYQKGQNGLGLATLEGKINLATQSAYKDLIDTFHLFGDPATNLPPTYFVSLPLLRH